MKVLRCLLGVAALVFGLSAASLSGATVELPKNSGTVSGVFAALPAPGDYVYVLTQYGFARVDVSDPANPTNPMLAQVGLKYVAGGSNGGVVGMECDCWQGGSTIDVAESSGGNARMVSDWLAQGQGLNGEVATATSSQLAFGQQIDVENVPLGSKIAVLYLPSGKFIAYFPYQSGAGGGIARADVTSPNGSPSKANGILAAPTIGWGNGKAVQLRAGLVNGKYLLVGASNTDKKIRIAEVDPTTGVPTEKSTIASAAGNVATLALASIEGRTFVFAAENTAGIRIYEYAGGELQAPVTLPGNYNEVMLRGGTLPIMFVHSIVSFVGRETYVEAWDTNWITRAGGNPAQARRGARLRHFGAAENYLGGFEARVVGSTGYLYRITPYGGTEAVLEGRTVDLASLTIDPNSAPIASSTATNLSAATRQGVERTINYYGDKWDIRDASASAPGPPANGLSQISWDWNFNGAFAADTGWSGLSYGANSTINPAYFPCDPAAGGNVETGSGCWASLGSPSGSGNYRYAVQTVNGVGASLPGPSPSTAVAAPKALIAGLDTSVNPPVLKVLTGQGQADARGSQGNTADAVFAWTFNPGNVAAAGPFVNVPATATSFSLRITYPGGYVATQSGSVSQVDLVPEFTPTQGSILVGGNLTITNAMQKSASTTLDSAEYAWDTASFALLPASFKTVGGTASVPAPSLGNNHTLRVRFNYLRAGIPPASVTVSHGPFNVSNSLIVSLTGPSTGRAGSPVTFTAEVQGGSGSPTFAWCWEACGFSPHFDPGPATNTHTYSSGGTKTVVVQVSDGGVNAVATAAIVISSSGGGGSLTATLSAPSSGKVNVPLPLSVSARGGTPPYSYAWCWEACNLGGTFEPGASSVTHTYTSTGTRSVAVRVTDAASRTLVKSASIAITEGGGGGGGGNPTVTIDGPSTGQVNQTLSFTANVTGGTSPFGYAWCWDACNLGGVFEPGQATVAHSFGSAGTRNVVVRVTDSANKTALGATSVVIGGSGKPAPASGFSVSGATLNPSNNTWQTEAGRGISLTADEANAASWAWDFGDGTTGSGRTVTKSFAATGSYTVRLTVTGDTTTTSGTSASTKKFAVGAPLFAAVAVPDAAYIVTADGTWKTDVTVTNGGATNLDITPLFVSYETLQATGPVIDVTSLGFASATKYTIPPGGSWSQADAVGFLGGSGKGNLFFKTDGGANPEVAARVYFEPNDPEIGAFGNAIPAFQIGAFGQVGVQSVRSVNPQTILGLRSDERQRFKLKLYNSSGVEAGFGIRAFDETGNPVALLDDGGNPIVDGLGQPLPRYFGVGAYRAAEVSDERLLLVDPTKRYVFQAEPVTTGAMLIASASVLDRTTNDQVQIADSDTRPAPEAGIVAAWIPGVSRLDSTGHWRTSISILNSGDAARAVLVEYAYGPTQLAQKTFDMASGQLLSFDDISELYPDVPEIATATSTSGLLRVTYTADADAAVHPVYVSARSYDDRSLTSGGTAGTALASFAAGDAIGFGDAPMVIPGIEQSDRFRTNVGMFALDPVLTIVKVSAVDKDGNVIGAVEGVPLNNNDPLAPSGPWSQFPITAISGLPTEAFSLRVEVKQGGRVGAYAINIDQKSLDTTFIKGTP